MYFDMSKAFKSIQKSHQDDMRSHEMALWIPKKTCCSQKWGCGKDFPETAKYFRPLTGKQAGYYDSYCHACAKLKRRKPPKAIVERHGPVKVCASKLGCGRSLYQSEFYGRQAICKSCYSARWVPQVREKRRLRRAKQLVKLGHGLTDGGKGSFTADSKEFS